MRVLFVTAEMTPLTKTGGLADVSAALPEALIRSNNVNVRVLMPAYPRALESAAAVREVLRLGDPLGWGATRLLEGVVPGTDVPVWLIDCPALYNRPGGPYQDATGRDWSDNHLRFALLAHVAAAIADECGGSWVPDLIHANDWHAGLVPALVSGNAGRKIPIVFTIHNLGYQGLFPAGQLRELMLPLRACESLEYHGQLSFLKAGIIGADAVTTVSPTYASEILFAEHGCGLDGALRARGKPPIGLFNGIDCRSWDPAHDPDIAARYSSGAMAGKLSCKRAFRAETGLDQIDAVPLLAFSSRLTHQKMPDTVLEAVPGLLNRGAQFALVAEGDKEYETAFRELAGRYPGQLAVHVGYDEALAHRLLAAADILLHPARYEPCGLVPLYAMRYGAVPVVRHCGGLADSVVDPASDGKEAAANGFSFGPPDTTSLIEAASRAFDAFAQPLLWRRLVAAGMAKDFGWSAAAATYAALYRSLTGFSDLGEDDAGQVLVGAGVHHRDLAAGADEGGDVLNLALHRVGRRVAAAPPAASVVVKHGEALRQQGGYLRCPWSRWLETGRRRPPG